MLFLILSLSTVIRKHVINDYFKKKMSLSEQDREILLQEIQQIQQTLEATGRNFGEDNHDKSESDDEGMLLKILQSFFAYIIVTLFLIVVMTCLPFQVFELK